MLKQFLPITVLVLCLNHIALAEPHPIICDAQATIEELKSLGIESRKKYKIYTIESLMGNEELREVVRAFYKLGHSCPQKDVLVVMIKELLALGYPNEYIPALVGYDLKLAGLKMYEIGDEWNRQLVTPEDLKEDSVLTKLYRSTLIMGLKKPRKDEGLTLTSVGTGFYLGKHNGLHLVATAKHVIAENSARLSENEACLKFVYHFPSGEKKFYTGKKWLGSWSDIDFVICAIDIPSADEADFIGRELSFKSKVVNKNTELSTIGFNMLNKYMGKPYFEKSNDCRVFIGSEQAQKKANKWSIATGCDAANGDSGSAIVDRHTGELLGFLSQTSIVKFGIPSALLSEFSEMPDKTDTLWEELSLAVPIDKIVSQVCVETLSEPTESSIALQSLCKN